MQNEFREAYANLFDNALTSLRRTISVKLKAIRYLNKNSLYNNYNDSNINYNNKSNIAKSYHEIRNITSETSDYTKIDLQPISQIEIE